MIMNYRIMAWESQNISHTNKAGMTEPQKVDGPRFDHMVIAQENLERYQANPKAYEEQLHNKAFFDVGKKLIGKKNLSDVDELTVASKVKEFTPLAIKTLVFERHLHVTGFIEELIKTSGYQEFINKTANEFDITRKTYDRPPVDQASALKTTEAANRNGQMGGGTRDVFTQKPEDNKRKKQEDKKSGSVTQERDLAEIQRIHKFADQNNSEDKENRPRFQVTG